MIKFSLLDSCICPGYFGMQALYIYRVYERCVLSFSWKHNFVMVMKLRMAKTVTSTKSFPY